MRSLSLLLLLFLATVFAADTDLAGGYTGEWKSGSSGNGGAIRFTLEPVEGGGWKSDASFALDGAEVKTTMREAKLREGRILLIYDFEIQGAALQSRMDAQWNGNEFTGAYATSLADGSQAVDSGTWTAKRKK